MIKAAEARDSFGISRQSLYWTSPKVYLRHHNFVAVQLAILESLKNFYSLLNWSQTYKKFLLLHHLAQDSNTSWGFQFPKTFSPNDSYWQVMKFSFVASSKTILVTQRKNKRECTIRSDSQYNMIKAGYGMNFKQNQAPSLKNLTLWGYSRSCIMVLSLSSPS